MSQPQQDLILDAQTLIGAGSNLLNLALGEPYSAPDLQEMRADIAEVLERIDDALDSLDAADLAFENDTEPSIDDLEGDLE